jgi:hypothetical protein
MVVFFAVAAFAVWVATQRVAPAFLIALSRLFRNPGLLGAAAAVRQAGVDGIANVKESQAWFAERARAASAGRDNDAVRVSVDPEAPVEEPRVRVESCAEDDAGEDEGKDEQSAPSRKA